MSGPATLARDVPPPSRLWVLVALAGSVTLGTGVVAGADRAWAAWLVSSVYLLGIGLGGVFFVAILYVTGASWGVAIRRVPEALAMTLPVTALAILALLVVRPDGYPWLHGLGEHAGPLAAFKAIWLWYPFFLARAVAYIALWITLARAIVGGSRRQDVDGSPAHTARNARLSAGGLVIFAITVSLASFDWIMSIEPEWYSTIFAVYQFAGLFLSTLAVVIVVVVWLRQRGPLRFVASDDHLHDLGKLLFAFSTFWMYVWFSQYMLIWYADIPEEASYFVLRTRGAWNVLFLLDMLLNWAVPFLVLLRRPPKQRPEILIKVAAVVLVGRWLDLYLMIVPPKSGPVPPFGVWEIASVLAIAGAAAVLVPRALGQASLVPARDPHLAESLDYRS
jgi:hypothetical protein